MCLLSFRNLLSCLPMCLLSFRNLFAVRALPFPSQNICSCSFKLSLSAACWNVSGANNHFFLPDSVRGVRPLWDLRRWRGKTCVRDVDQNRLLDGTVCTVESIKISHILRGHCAGCSRGREVQVVSCGWLASTVFSTHNGLDRWTSGALLLKRIVRTAVLW